MYIRQLGTFHFLRIYISNNNVGYNKAEGEEQEDGRSLYSVELFADFDTDCSTHPDYVCSCINDDDDGEDIEDVNDKVDEMYCYKMSLKTLIPTMTTMRTRRTRRTRRESLVSLSLSSSSSSSLLREKTIGEREGEGEIGGSGEKVRIGRWMRGWMMDDG